MFNFLTASGKFLKGAAINDIDLVRTEAQRSPCSIHCNVAAADDRNVSALHDGGHGISLVCLHEVAAGQEFVCGVNAFVCLTGDVHEVGKACTGTDENSFKALFEQLVNGESLADNGVGFHINAHGGQVVNFLLNNCLGQTEFGNTVNKNTACGVQSFVNGDFIALLGKVARAGKAGGAGTYNCNAVAVGRRSFGSFGGMSVMPIGNKAFKSADADGFAFDAANALAFALEFLRTYPAADCGQRGGLLNDLICALEIVLANLCDKLGDMDVDRAAADAGHLRAVETAERLVKRGLFGIAGCNLVKVVCAYFGCLGGHFVLFGAHVRHIILPPC